MKIKKAVIPAAVLGTRFLQATINFALKRPDQRSRLLAYMSRILHEEKLLSGSRRAVFK